MKRVNNLRCAAAAYLFIGMTALKLILPQATAPARAWLRESVERSFDYTAALRELGGDIAEVFHPAEAALDVPAALYEPVTVEMLRRETASRLPEGTLPAQEGTGELIMPEAVEAFLTKQAEYSQYAVPADVSYEMPELPFTYQSPVSGVTSSGFGFRVHPLEGIVKFHYGTDFASDSGTEVLCFAFGSVAEVGYDAGYGNYLTVDHGNGWKTLYGHCSKVLAKEGDYVYMGQPIARVGATGEATGPHLHFELTGGGIRYNPEFYFAA